jgi:hypothetical protein
VFPAGHVDTADFMLSLPGMATGASAAPIPSAPTVAAKGAPQLSPTRIGPTMVHWSVGVRSASPAAGAPPCTSPAGGHLRPKSLEGVGHLGDGMQSSKAWQRMCSLISGGVRSNATVGCRLWTCSQPRWPHNWLRSTAHVVTTKWKVALKVSLP